MTGETLLRRHPYLVAEVGLAVLTVLGSVGFAAVVLSTSPGAWTVANATLAAAELLAVVLLVHAVVDLRRLLGDEDWPRTRGRAILGSIWRSVELGLVAAFVFLGLVSGWLVEDLASHPYGEQEGTMGMVLVMYMVLEVVFLGALVVMVLGRAFVTATGGEDEASPSDEGGGFDPGAAR